MLTVGLTGGIAAGKSLAATRLEELGAVVIDADMLAREVVEPGTMGLRAVAKEFGAGIVNDDDGGLDRAALGALVFGSSEKRERLNRIIHPLVRALALERTLAAPRDAVVVQDIPLLVETGQGNRFHLVVVVDAPDEQRITRMTGVRGMSAEDAGARIAAQTDRATRNAAADVVLDNSSGPDDLFDAVDTLWAERLAPFNANLLTAKPADRAGGPVLTGPLSAWPAEAGRLADRLLRIDERVLRVDHIGSTAVPYLAAKDVIDLQLTVASLEDADALDNALAGAGFPRLPGIWRDDPKPAHPDPSEWGKRLHCNADPGRPVNLHVRVLNSPGWRYALSFRDWLRAAPGMTAAYLAEKQRCAGLHAQDARTAGYAACKEAWFTEFADPRLSRWIADTGWMAPRD
ncbi:dephospho-CoA kinase [Arthrobacter sp. H5]|uniref:dephospho-CoA kinase n=1 Tax=Arthrobacter sp. H5 TaxID=1267973 RepID=UPI000481E2DD|nr:dephospho-CoA kinase [Arthrobacter sp. H5]